MEHSLAKSTFVVMSWMGLALIVLLGLVAAIGGIPWFIVPLAAGIWFGVSAVAFAFYRRAER